MTFLFPSETPELHRPVTPVYLIGVVIKTPSVCSPVRLAASQQPLTSRGPISLIFLSLIIIIIIVTVYFFYRPLWWLAPGVTQRCVSIMAMSP